METKIIKKWIRGNKERGSEVIKILKDLGGKEVFNLFNGKSEASIYFINARGIIDAISTCCTSATAIMWIGEEIKLPEPKPEPKFKVGDKVKYFVVTGNNVLTISKVEYTFDKYYYYFEGKNGCYEEKYLQPANTLKESDPVMVSEDGKTWKPAIYNTHSTVYMLLEENDSASKSYKYIVPLSDFDFHNLESNIERSVV